MAPLVEPQEDLRLRQHLALLFPGYAGDRRGLLATLTEDELRRAFKRLALESHPDRVASGDRELARLFHERFLRTREAYEALRRVVAGSAGCAPVEAGASGPAEPEASAFGLAADSARQRTAPRILAVGGAKGGVGKSTLSASLATALAMMGHRVVAVDLDLGGADLHLFLGVRQPERTLGHLWAHLSDELSGVLSPTGVPLLSLVAGDSSALGSANIKHAQKQKLLRQLRRLPAEWVVLDLGGDTTFNTLDFLLVADERLVVTTADPASVLDAYNFVKVALLRLLAQAVEGGLGNGAFAAEAEARLQRFVAECGRPGGPTIGAFLAELAAVDRRAVDWVAGVLAGFRPKLVLNQSDPTGGKEVIERIRAVCREHLRIEPDLCHLVPGDPEILKATRRITNIISARYQGGGAQAIWALACKLAAAGRSEGAPKPRASTRGAGGDTHGAAPGSRPAGRPSVESRFFQPPWLFPLLSRALEPVAHAAPAAGRPVRAWYLGGGTGAGPYSLAIALEETAARAGGTPWEVAVTGVSAAEAEEAARGTYARVFVEHLRADTLQRHFLRGTGLNDGLCAIKPSIRERVSFLAGSPIDAPPSPGPFHVVLVDLPAERVASLCRGSFAGDLAACLAPAGLLVVPAWPSAAPPLAFLTRLQDGIFPRSGPAAPSR